MQEVGDMTRISNFAKGISKGVLVVAVGCWLVLILEFLSIGEPILALAVLLALPVLATLLILEYIELKRKETAFAWTSAAFAIVSLAIFIWAQLASIQSKEFLELVFSSFFFLGFATISALIIYKGSTLTRKTQGVAVSIILIIGTVFVANSLTLNPPGGGHASNLRTIEDFDVNVQGQNGTNQMRYYGRYSEVIHRPDYAASEIRLDTFGHDWFAITPLTPANVNGTLYISFALKPYESNFYPLFSKEIVFAENSTEQYFSVYVNPIWGGNYGFLKEDLPRVRFEGYDIEFTLQLILTGAQTEPPTLNFSIRSELGARIQEDFVISKFQNNLAVALCGVFVGINVVVPATYVFYLVSKRRKNNEIDEQE